MGRTVFEKWRIPVYADRRGNLGFAAHLHTSVEIVYVINGRAAAWIDEKRYEILPGQAAVIFPGQKHSYEYVAPCNSYIMIFEKDLLRFFDPLLVRMRPENPVIDVPAAEALFEAATTAYREKGPLYREKLQAQAILLLVELLPKLRLNKGSNVRTDAAEELIVFVNDNFDREITLESTAHLLNVSQAYITRFFRERMNTTFLKYVQDLRLEKAQKLLRETEEPITEVAIRSGYNALRSFNRNFVAAFGITPSAYRKKQSTAYKNTVGSR